MGSVLHPIGDQPAWVYWARRGVLVVAALVVLGVIIMMFRPAPDAPVAAVPASATPVPAATAAPTESASPSASATPTGPAACDPTNSELAVAGYQKVKQGGKQLFKVAVSNKGSADCVLDLSAETFNLVVTSGSDQLWTTEDCAKLVPEKKTTLKPQKSHEFSIEWPLKRSAPGCRTTKAKVLPGTYVGTATFADSVTARQVFLVQKG